MYILINPDTGIEVGKFSQVFFVTEINIEDKKGYVASSYEEAQGLFLDHILYRIEDRTGISETYPVMRVVLVPESEAIVDVYNQEEHNKAYIDYLSLVRAS